MEKTKFFQSNNNEVTCNLCNHACRIKNNDVGICGVRENVNGKLNSLVYGYPVAINVDPIEKKPLFHFLPGSNTYSIGTLGCNFKCSNCQNWNISQVEQIKRKISKLDYHSPEKIVENALGEDCQSISFTYNEPTIFTEYALDIMKLAHENGLKNVWVSNGYMSDKCLDSIIPYLDAINIDLKSIENNFYKQNCSANLAPVLNNIEKLRQEQVHVELTTLIIPTLTNESMIFEEIANYIVDNLDTDVPWHISKFSPEISWKLENLPSTEDASIYEAHRIGKEAGLKYVYVGNIPGDPKENTYCPHCKEIAVMRFGYNVDRKDDAGRCVYCDTSLDIIE